MPMCSYCCENVGADVECFGWLEARGCGITGPDDPKRLASRDRHDAHQAKCMRQNAKILRDEAEREARKLERHADRIDPAMRKPVAGQEVTG